MKFLTSAFIILVSAYALAYGQPQINWPSINGLSVGNACATDTTFRSLKPVEVCTATKVVRYATDNNGGEQGPTQRFLKDGEQERRGEFVDNMTVCASYGLKNLEVSRTYKKTECAYYMPAGEGSEPCNKFITQSLVAGLNFSVETLTYNGDITEQKFFKYTVPACQ